MPSELSLEIKGCLFPNADGSNRMFELRMLNPGDVIGLLPEPKNKHDPLAVAVISPRGYQLGYLSAERCGWIGSKIREGRDVRAVFQERTADAGIIRVNLDGKEPTLPPARAAPPSIDAMVGADPESGFFPDYIPPDD